MEKKLDLSLNLTLSEMAKRRAVINLCNESDMSAMVGPRTAGSEISKRVKEKISKLVIPETLKKRMAGFVLPFRLELVRFKSLHKFIFNNVPSEEFDSLIWGQLCWTFSGVVDHQKTAEKLVRLQIIDIEKRYRLACLYCFENYIPVLWEELPESYKSRFEGAIYPLPENVVHLEYYWAFVMKGEGFKLNDVLPSEFTHASSTYQSYFKYSACVVGKAATEYFFQKLTDEEKNSAIYQAFAKSCNAFIITLGAPENRMQCVLTRGLGNCRSNVLYYLLSLMTHKQQMSVLRLYHYECLLCFMNWPWPALFFDMADFTRRIIPESQYVFLLKLVFAYFTLYDVPELFQKFFMCSPINFRKRFADIVREHPVVLSYYVREGDAQTIRAVLKNLDSGEKMRLFSSPHFLKSLCLSKWHLVKMCIGQDSLSKQDRKRLKDIYEGFRMNTMGQMNFDLGEIKWKQLFDILDETSVSTNSTNCSEDEDLARTKRTCSEEEDYESTKKIKIQKCCH